MNLIEFFQKNKNVTRKSLAEKIGVHPINIGMWANGKRKVPLEHCTKIEIATGGAVTRKDLRPDDWHEIWIELVENFHYSISCGAVNNTIKTYT